MKLSKTLTAVSGDKMTNEKLFLLNKKNAELEILKCREKSYKERLLSCGVLKSLYNSYGDDDLIEIIEVIKQMVDITISSKIKKLQKEFDEL